MRFLYEAVMGLRTPDKTGAILADEMGLGERRRGGWRGTGGGRGPVGRGYAPWCLAWRGTPRVEPIAIRLEKSIRMQLVCRRCATIRGAPGCTGMGHGGGRCLHTVWQALVCGECAPSVLNLTPWLRLLAAPAPPPAPHCR